MAKLPGYMIEFQIAIDGVKRYTGWTDEEFAKQLGVSVCTIRSAKRDPCSVNGGIILKVQDMLQQLRKKNNVL